MTEQIAKEILNDLRNGTIDEYRISKHEFRILRDVLIKQNDVNDFRGIAHPGGDVTFIYQPGWTK